MTILPDYKKFFDLKKITKEIANYLPSFDEELFIKAFNFAENAHRGQMRKDGKTPYIAHPVNVLRILVSLHADQDILISSLLHDVPEDTEFDIHEVKKHFGETVAFLVNGITKLSKVHYQHNMPDRQIQSLKKLFIHSAKDPRVILIKLADRLHNMRTLQFVSAPEKRLRIARETLEIYVPMANLLGIQSLKSELEDLCFKNLFPTEYEKLFEAISKKSSAAKKSLNKFIDILKSAVKESDVEAEIVERKQSLYKVYSKLCAGKRPMGGAEERLAVRIVVNSIPECYEALGLVHGIFTPKSGKFKDYIANPKINKYRSLHTIVFGIDGIVTEVQIRTTKMNLEAEYGIASIFFEGKKISFGEDDRSSWVNKVLDLDKVESENKDFLANLKGDVFQDRIVVYTPKGGTIDLPKGASAIDFAYCVHTDVGSHAAKADINGTIFPVTTMLNTGDVVKIVTDKDYRPSLSWLSFVRTTLAKNEIHHYLKRTTKDKKINGGHRILQKEFDIAGIGLIEDINYKKIRSQLDEKLSKRFDTLEMLLTAIGTGDLKAIDVVKALKKPSKKSLEEGIKVNIKVVASNRFGLMREVSRIFYKHSLDMTHLKAWTSSGLEDAFFTYQIRIADLETLTHLFQELEQMDDIKYVTRIHNNILYLSYSLIALTGILWISHPFIWQLLIRSSWVKFDRAIANFIAYSALFMLFMMVMLITKIMRRYIPYIRNRKLLWGFAFGVPVLAVASLMIDLLYFDFNLNWVALLVEIFIVYLYLAISFYNLKKNL